MSFRSRLLLPALVFASVTAAATSSVGSFLMPAVAETYNVPVSTAQWILTINLLVGAVATPVIGSLSDGRSQKRVLTITLIICTLGGLVAAATPHFGMLVVGRALQGVAFGLVPTTLSIARRRLRPEHVNGAIATLTTTVAVGMGLGYPIAGFIAEIGDPRLAFFFSAVFAACATAVTVSIVPSDKTITDVPRRRLDVLGTALLSIGLAALLVIVSEWTHLGGLSSPFVIGGSLVAIGFLACWILSALRAEHPLVDLRAMKRPDALLANATCLGAGTAVYIVFSVVSIISQSPASTGFGLALPMYVAGSIVVPFALGSFIANRMLRLQRLQTSMTIVLGVGLATLTTSCVWVIFWHSSTWQLVVGMTILGLGTGASYASMAILIAQTVPALQTGSAISFNHVVRTAGGALGAAVTAAAVAAHLTPDQEPTETGMIVALSVAVIFLAVAMLWIPLRTLFVRT